MKRGGVGKTTTTVNVAAWLADSGANVLVIDLDPQGKSHKHAGYQPGSGRGSSRLLQSRLSPR
ncbi:MAG: ParA family protein [Thermomicrobiales bacterium]